EVVRDGRPLRQRHPGDDAPDSRLGRGQLPRPTRLLQRASGIRVGLDEDHAGHGRLSFGRRAEVILWGEDTVEMRSLLYPWVPQEVGTPEVNVGIDDHGWHEACFQNQIKQRGFGSACCGLRSMTPRT